MNISHFFIDRPIFATVLSIVITLVGGIALMTLPVSQVAQLDREVLNRWFLEHTGAVSFVPFMGAALNIGNDPDLVARFDSLFTFELPEHEHESGPDPGHEVRAEYLPEITHVARLDRAAMVSGWTLDESHQRIAALRARIAETLPWEAGLNVASDLAPSRHATV